MSTPNPMQVELGALGQRIERLLDVNQRMAEEIRTLRQAQDALVAERANLLAKNDQARTRIEAMISRLKALEQT